jgi:hypothetical protein
MDQQPEEDAGVEIEKTAGHECEATRYSAECRCGKGAGAFIL